MANKIYKAAVIGCGKIGVEAGNYQKEVQPATHAGAYKAHPRIKLAGFADIDPKRLKAAARNFPGVPLFKSADELLKEIQPDIVSISTQPDSHLELVKLAAKHNTKAIVCEKPIAKTLEEAKEIIKECKKSGSLLFVNHTRRFGPLFRKVRKEIQEGKFGRIYQITYYYYNGIFNNGTHLIDLLRFFFGEIDWVIAVENKKTINHKLKDDINVDGLVHFKNGAVAALQSLPPNYGFSEIYILGEKGGIFFKDLGYRVEERKLVKNKYFKGYYQLSFQIKTYGKVRGYMISMADHVVKCLDSKEKPVSTGKDGLAALKILFAIKKSAENSGRRITIK